MAKILIEIDDKTSEILNKPYHSYTDIHDKLAYPLYKAVRNGVVIPDNATNGDIIKALWNVTEVDDKYKVTTFLDIDDVPWVMSTDKDWWNAPYKVGDTDGNS